MSKLRLEHIRKQYEDYDWQLSISFSLNDGEIVTLLGPSGCGKTTTLRIIAGFEQVDGGQIWLDNATINDVPPYRRNIGVVFQDYALFPHMNVFKNIAFGMQRKKIYTRRQIRERVAELLTLVGLEGYDLRYPDQLSGGEQQRIALLRAIAPHPDILLLDEPLSALDFQLRKRLRQEIKNIQRKLGITMLYVTHDQEEAMSISDRIVVMRAGHVEQIGTPVEVYQSPQTQYVAQFVGISNVISGIIQHVEGRSFVLHTPQKQIFVIPKHKRYKLHDQVTFFFRPEDSFLSAEPAAKNVIRGKILEHEYLGSEILTSVTGEDHHVYVVSNYIKHEVFIGHEGFDVCVNFPPEACKIVTRRAEEQCEGES